jgi:hypothetical protein
VVYSPFYARLGLLDAFNEKFFRSALGPQLAS